MKIQVITYDKNKYRSFIDKDLNANNFTEAISFDNFDFNIIDLTNDLFWKFKDGSCGHFAYIDMINHLQKMINSTHNNILIILPKNIEVKYNYLSGKYNNTTQLKNVIHNFKNVLTKFFSEELVNSNIVFEKNCTKLKNNENFKSDFYFEVLNDIDIIQTTENKNKVVTLRVGFRKNIYITTLYSLVENNIIKNVIDGIFGSAIVDVPEWVKNVNFYTDEELNEKNLQLESEIDIIKCKIEENNEKLNKNKEYKKILYTNADILVKNVTMILEEMLDCDCSDFIDEKKEDLRINLNDTTLIFEIKGENDGVKQSNISQLTTHIELYEEKLEEEGEEKENIKGILIKNEFKNKPVSERDPVHINVIQKAQRSKCLIITSKLLLDLFEKFKMSEITTEQVKEILKNQIGLLDLNNL